jgi:hypothetical protein
VYVSEGGNDLFYDFIFNLEHKVDRLRQDWMLRAKWYSGIRHNASF